MFQKVISIKNIGRFRDYKPSGDVTFRKVTVIYSENARGKSTLSALLRSLATGDVAPLIARKTLGEKDQSQIEVLSSSGKVAFDGSKWSALMPEIETFDSTFVNEHVFSGAYVDHEHRTRLHRFAIGNEGVKLAKAIAALDERSRQTAAKRTDKEKEVQRCIVGGLTIGVFLKLPDQTDLDTKIVAAEAEVAALGKVAEIAKQPGLAALAAPVIDLVGTLSLLNRTLGSVSQRALELTRQQIATCMDHRGERWIAAGLQFLKGDVCPFCNRSVAGLELITAYQAYFDAAYAELTAAISDAITAVSTSLDEAKIVGIERTLETNDARAANWKSYVSTEYPALDAVAARLAISECCRQLGEALKHKCAAPLEVIEPRPELMAACEGLKKLIVEIAAHNEAVAVVNAKIAEKKVQLKTGNLADAKQQCELLKSAKARHAEPAKTLCAEYIAISLEKEQIEKDKGIAKKTLEDRTHEILKKYEARINYHLTCFGASFQIAETSQRYVGGRPSSIYCLVVNGIKVAIGDTKTASNVPCFGTVLSDGDKSTLAFALFLARLEQDPELKTKIVVFDDPISSLDGHRKDCTQQAICALSKSALQVIVCSHDALFLRSVWDACVPAERHPLTISLSGAGSHLGFWEIELETMGDYFRRVRSMELFVAGKSKEKPIAVAQCIRIALEANLRIRFPSAFSATEWLGEFLKKIRNAKGTDPLVKMQPCLTELDAVNDYSKKYHHDQNPKADSAPISEIALAAYCGRTLSLLSGV